MSYNYFFIRSLSTTAWLKKLKAGEATGRRLQPSRWLARTMRCLTSSEESSGSYVTVFRRPSPSVLTRWAYLLLICDLNILNR